MTPLKLELATDPKKLPEANCWPQNVFLFKVVLTETSSHGVELRLDPGVDMNMRKNQADKTKIGKLIKESCKTFPPPPEKMLPP